MFDRDPMAQPPAATGSASNSTALADRSLQHDSLGRLIWCGMAGSATPVQVHPVRAFPLTAPDQAIALVDTDGREHHWIEHMQDCSLAMQTVLRQALAEREFTPVITAITAVSGFLTPCQWTVQTDRGQAAFTLKSEDDIRRLQAGGLLITDQQGITYRIHDRFAMDRGSKKILDRFL